jgi:hypothetical protein
MPLLSGYDALVNSVQLDVVDGLGWVAAAFGKPRCKFVARSDVQI